MVCLTHLSLKQAWNVNVCDYYSRSRCTRITLVHLNIRTVVPWVDEIKPNQGDAVLSALQTETYCATSSDETIRVSHNANHANHINTSLVIPVNSRNNFLCSIELNLCTFLFLVKFYFILFILTHIKKILH